MRGKRQGQDNVPHNGEVISTAFVLKNQDAAFKDARKIVDSEQIFYDSMHILQRVTSPLNGDFVKGKFHVHFVSPPVV